MDDKLSESFITELDMSFSQVLKLTQSNYRQRQGSSFTVHVVFGVFLHFGNKGLLFLFGIARYVDVSDKILDDRVREMLDLFDL